MSHDPKHTPGPWQLTERNLSGRKTVCSPRLGLIAILAEHDVGPHEWEQDEANAKLIAAAPVLLDALKGLVAESHYGHAPEAYDAAREAIELATGQEVPL